MSGVWQGSNIKVWYKLADAQQPTKVCVDASFDIDDLKKVIKSEHSISLSHCDASRLLIFPHMQSYVVDGNSTASSGQVNYKVLDPGELIPLTTSKEPLIVKVPLSSLKSSLNQTQLNRNDKNRGQEYSSEVKSPTPLYPEMNLSRDEVQPMGPGNFTRDNCDKNEIDNNNNTGQNLLKISNKNEEDSNKVIKQEMSSDEGNEDENLVTNNPSIKLEWDRMKKRKKIRKKKKRETEGMAMAVKKRLSNLAVRRSNYLGGNIYEDNDTAVDQNDKEMNDKMQEKEADTSSERKQKIVNIKNSKKEVKKGATSPECLVSLGDDRSNGSEYIQEKNPPNTQFCRHTNKKDEQKQKKKEVVFATNEVAYVSLDREIRAYVSLDRKIRSLESDNDKDSCPVMSQDQFTVFNEIEKKVHKSKKSRREKTVESSPMLDTDRTSRTTPSPKLKKGHICKLKCLQVTDEKDKSKKKRLNEDNLEQEYIDETLCRARIEFTANIKKRRRENYKFVRRGTEMKNAVCHICHYRRPLGYQFVCRIHNHIYCEKHCLDRLGFDLSSQGTTYKRCPICCLQCTCAKCQRQVHSVASLFKKQCHQQGLGLDETDMEVLQLCSPKLQSMRSDDGNNIDDKDYVIRIAHKKTHMTSSESTYSVQNNFSRQNRNQLKVADSANSMEKNRASNELEKHVCEPHRKIQLNHASNSPPIPKRKRREDA